MQTDLSYLKSISGDDAGLMSEMIDIFVEQVVDLKNEMQEMLDKRDYTSLGKVAHKAKTSVAIMGMKSITEELKNFELQTIEGINTGSYQQYIDNFEKETQEAIVELMNFKKEIIRTKL